MDNSRLNKLPGELRNRIYRLALVQSSNIEIQVADSTKFSNLKHDTLALLSTCGQIRTEASPIFFAENTFEVETDLLFPGSIHQGPTARQEAVFHRARFTRMLIGGWLLSLGQHARHIKHIKFSIGSWRAYNTADDWIICAVPAMLKDIRALFRATAATPRLRLRCYWSNGQRYSNDFFVSPVVALRFSDGHWQDSPRSLHPSFSRRRHAGVEVDSEAGRGQS